MTTATRSQANLAQLPRKVKVFDVDKKEQIEGSPFESMSAASHATGVKRGTIISAIEHKSRNTSNNLGKTLAFR